MRSASPLLLATLLATLLAACAGEAAPPATPAAPLDEAPRARGTAVRASVSAPSRVAFEGAALGRNDALVAIRVTNEGDAPVKVGPLRVAFALRKGAVAYACDPVAPSRDLDAGTLAPGATFRADEPLRCWTPLAGAYEGEASIAFRDERVVAPFAIEVVDRAGRAARPYAPDPGLYVLAGGDPRVVPIAPTAAEDGGYRAAVLFVNDADRGRALPPARVSLVVYRRGDALPCTGESSLRALPAIGPGEVHVEHVPIGCLRDRTGDYEVHVLVALGDGPQVEAGRFPVRVTREAGVVLLPYPNP